MGGGRVGFAGRGRGRNNGHTPNRPPNAPQFGGRNLGGDWGAIGGGGWQSFLRHARKRGRVGDVPARSLAAPIRSDCVVRYRLCRSRCQDQRSMGQLWKRAFVLPTKLPAQCRRTVEKRYTKLSQVQSSPLARLSCAWPQDHRHDQQHLCNYRGTAASTRRQTQAPMCMSFVLCRVRMNKVSLLLIHLSFSSGATTRRRTLGSCMMRSASAHCA